jgi:hypothetical protein
MLQNLGTDHAQKKQPFYCCVISQSGLSRNLDPGRPSTRWLLPSTDNIENVICPCLLTQLLKTSYKDSIHYCFLYSLLRECLSSHYLATMAFLYCYRNGPYVTIRFGSRRTELCLLSASYLIFDFGEGGDMFLQYPFYRI